MVDDEDGTNIFELSVRLGIVDFHHLRTVFVQIREEPSKYQ